MFDTHSILARSDIVSILNQNATTVVISVSSGEGVLFSTSQQVTIWPKQPEQPSKHNAMIGRVTDITGDQLTINVTTTNREGSNTRTVLVEDQIANTITPKALTDIEEAALLFAFVL